MLENIIKNIHASAPVNAMMAMRSWAFEGVREDEGSNRGSTVDAIVETGYGEAESGDPWCARAVQAAWRIGGWVTGQQMHSGISKSGSVFYMLHSTYKAIPVQVLLCNYDMTAQQVERFAAKLLPGDAMIRYTIKPEFVDVPFDDLKRSMTHKGHVEILQGARPDGTLDTVGGNTDSDTSRDGDGVYCHEGRYNIKEQRVVGFVRPLYIPNA